WGRHFSRAAGHPGRRDNGETKKSGAPVLRQSGCDRSTILASAHLQLCNRYTLEPAAATPGIACEPTHPSLSAR
ncbi:MAG: hypothetical protein ACXVDF_24180, partial [Ktedonobacterales bacterium]